jgi:3-oxoacyl-[acyl-carrier protein] reductase
VFSVAAASARRMKERRAGRLVLIASTAGQRGEAHHSHYAATKGAIISLTKSLATELAPFGVLVNCVAPGWVRTPMTREALTDPKVQADVVRTIPLGRVATPEEIAAPVLFLAGPGATFITGEILNVNGGAVLVG